MYQRQRGDDQDMGTRKPCGEGGRDRSNRATATETQEPPPVGPGKEGFHQSLQKVRPCLHLIFQFFGLQNREGIHVYCFWPPVYGILLWPPGDEGTLTPTISTTSRWGSPQAPGIALGKMHKDLTLPIPLPSSEG